MAALNLRDNGFTLALGGGGALGFAHVGVLNELKARSLLPKAVAGTSMGAVVGAAWCLGENTVWDALSHGASNLQFWAAVATRGFTLRLRLRSLFRTATLGDCRVPLVVCAAWTDDPSNPVYFEAPDLELWRVLAASTALPLVFTPVEVCGRRYLDGGCADNLPCAPLRRYGLPIVGVELGFLDSALRGDTQPDSWATKGLARLGLYARYRDLGDILLQPDLSGFTPQSFHEVRKIAQLGAECVRRNLRDA